MLSIILALQIASKEPFSLEPFPGENSIRVVDTQMITGKCDDAVVTITGVEGRRGNEFKVDDSATVFVRKNGKEVIVNKLSDLNGMKCLIGRNYVPMLLIWSNCGGAWCGDKYGFQVINIESLEILSKKYEDIGCDELCAYALTGDTLPLHINHVATSEQ